MTSLRAALLVGLLAALVVAATPAGAPAAAVRGCGQIGFAPNSEDGVFRIRAKGVGCKRARRVARGARSTSPTRGPFHFRAAGFRCHGVARTVGLPSTAWRCKRGRAVVTFSRA